MEEAKAAAYYDELTRKGEGAARFKQGLGFSSAVTNSSDPPARGSAFVSSSSSFLSSFVKASSPSKAPELDRKSQLASIQNKLRTKKEKQKSPSRETRVSRRRSRSRSRSRSRERERERDHRSRRRSRSRERRRDRDSDRESRRRRSRSRSDSDGDRRRRARRRRSRSSSPSDRRAERRNRSPSPARERRPEKRKVGVDYSQLITGYDRMSPAERVKAKTKLQLSETVEKDMTKGSSGWERFEFNKDAPLEDEEIEVAEDDTVLVKNNGQSFRFTAIEAKREQNVRDAHDNAMFGVPVISHVVTTESEVESETDADKDESIKSEVAAKDLLSEKVLAKQQGSWRDRARRPANSQG